MRPDYRLKINIRPTIAIRKNQTSKGNSVISRLCLAVIDEIDGEFKALVRTSNSEDVMDKFCLPLTPKSLNLKDKIYVFSKTKDEYGNNVLIIRDKLKAHIFFGSPKQFTVVRKNCLISGYIVKIDGKMYFDYDNLIAFSPTAEHLNPCNIDNSKSIFLK